MLIRGDEEFIQIADWSVAEVDLDDGGRVEVGTAYTEAGSLDRREFLTLEVCKSGPDVERKMF